jgi:hypothetical protein
LNSIEVVGWDSAAAIIKALTENNYEVLVLSDEGPSPWHDQRRERFYHIEFSHRKFENGFVKAPEDE